MLLSVIASCTGQWHRKRRSLQDLFIYRLKFHLRSRSAITKLIGWSLESLPETAQYSIRDTAYPLSHTSVGTQAEFSSADQGFASDALT
jgi:hypothetical protein